jgi:recombinational DNA repair ATPase RecF
MLSLKTLLLTQFRNYIQKQFEFNTRIVGIVGANGTGKTNILDAIYYLSFTKSYFNRPDAQNVHHAFQGMRVNGQFDFNVNNTLVHTSFLPTVSGLFFDEIASIKRDSFSINSNNLCSNRNQVFIFIG